VPQQDGMSVVDESALFKGRRQSIEKIQKEKERQSNLQSFMNSSNFTFFMNFESGLRRSFLWKKYVDLHIRFT